jgi:hypothetical protein
MESGFRWRRYVSADWLLADTAEPSPTPHRRTISRPRAIGAAGPTSEPRDSATASATASTTKPIPAAYARNIATPDATVPDRDVTTTVARTGRSSGQRGHRVPAPDSLIDGTMRRTAAPAPRRRTGRDSSRRASRQPFAGPDVPNTAGNPVMPGRGPVYAATNYPN